MTIDWHEKITDFMLDKFVETGFLIIDNCFEADFLQKLQHESGFIEYQEAHLTHGERVTNIRGDSTRWLDESLPIGWQYLQAIDRLGQFFNQTLYAGIRHCEAHYARYPVGFGYQWHSDNPVGRDERVISAVFYLNDNWGEHDGGEIELTDKQNHQQKLLPKANRLVVFDSNLLHQVAITHRERFSIATWMRKDD
ncbi:MULTISPECIES: 2OG-Fe(II) oxygenase [unclassified Moraxella]|uniref:2OG-Fe(II) oxygenase n=1 Tax=unclassified Moraxella TaxID=2685852 RepID=UPI003AF928E3